MNLVQLTEDAYHLRSGSNAGLLVDGQRALLVDTGLDRDSARRILKQVNGLGVEIVAILITHAHADHFGGAADLKRRTGAPVLAPAFEAAVVENSALEPVYLFAGAQPVKELLGKFIRAKACVVDGLLEPGQQTLFGFEVEVIPAPGHAHNQMMIGWPQEGVCFAADAFFPPAVLNKYGIPFYVDIDQTLETLEALPGLLYGVFAQGHGDATTHDADLGADARMAYADLGADTRKAYADLGADARNQDADLGADARKANADLGTDTRMADGTGGRMDLDGVVVYNRERVLDIRQRVLNVVDEPCEATQVLKQVADGMGVAITQPAIYYLSRTTIHACLNSLRRAGLIDLELSDNRLLWRRL